MVPSDSVGEDGPKLMVHFDLVGEDGPISMECFDLVDEDGSYPVDEDGAVWLGILGVHLQRCTEKPPAGHFVCVRDALGKFICFKAAFADSGHFNSQFVLFPL